ncbi:MAG: hypothetical protein AAF621_00585 [Pseudomonadota bacterium]
MDFNTETLLTLWDIFQNIVIGASLFVGLTKTPKDDEFMGKVYPWVEKAALIFGRAKERA